LSAFYKHKQMKDGHLNKCKTCTKSDVGKHYSDQTKDHAWIEKERARNREKYHRLNYREKHKPTPEAKAAQIRRHKEKYPEKVAAKNKSNHLRPNIAGNHLHHWSYNTSHFKDVIELSMADHYTLHRFLDYDQESKMYKTKEGELLDTREKHERYAEDVFRKHRNT